VTTGRPPLSLGDAIRALDLLRPTDDATVAAVLGLVGLTERGPAPVTPPAPKRRAQEDPDVEVPNERRRRRPQRPLGSREATVSEIGNVLPSSLDAQPPTGTQGIAGVPQLAQGDDEPRLPPIEPLFVPRWIRGILGAAISVPLPDGPPDLDRIVDAVARRQALRAVPRQAAPTLRLGVQLLVDRSTRMAPFARDQEWLEWALRRVLGETSVAVYPFVGTPLPVDGGPSYRLPATGTPVLALTDLGIARPMFDSEPSDAAAWLGFAEAVRRGGCALTAFVPYPPSRWPARLGEAMTVIQWERTTSVATIRGVVGAAAVR
jgi:hypothetical protein